MDGFAPSLIYSYSRYVEKKVEYIAMYEDFFAAKSPSRDHLRKGFALDIAILFAPYSSCQYLLDVFNSEPVRHFCFSFS
jgi:hypothetical protein